MHDVTKLLLARLESNPEEFTSTGSLRGIGRWYKVLNKLQAALPPDEWAMFEGRLHAVQLDQLHKDVMSALCAPPHPEQMDMLGTSENDVNTTYGTYGASVRLDAKYVPKGLLKTLAPKKSIP